VPVRLHHFAGHDRNRDFFAGEGQVADLAGVGVEDAEDDVGPLRAFDLRRRGFAVLPGKRFAVDRDDHVAGLDPGPLRGRLREDLRRVQAARHLRDGEPDAGEAAADRLVEVFEQLGREVFGEAVVVAEAQIADHAPQRAVGEVVFVDLAVVVILDQFGRFGGQARRIVDEDVAQGRRHLRRMAAHPEAGRQHGDQRGREGDSPPAAHAGLRPSGSGAG
jgi:hypothetical protein